MTQIVDVATAELTGAALNYAVAQAIGLKVVAGQYRDEPVAVIFIDTAYRKGIERIYLPSESWFIAGQLRDEFKIAIYDIPGGVAATVRDIPEHWIDESSSDATGPTARIAICRAIVLNKLGETVQLPAEIMPQ